MSNDNSRPEKLLTAPAVAALWQVDPKTVVRWAQGGKLPGVKTPGGQWRFRESVMLALLNGDRK